jgi:uncharacterized protein (TIGR03382 family)
MALFVPTAASANKSVLGPVSNAYGLSEEHIIVDDGPGLWIDPEIKPEPGKDFGTLGLFSARETNLGDGLSLPDAAADPSGTLVKMRVNAEQWKRLSSPSGYSSELRYISNIVYSKFKDDFDFLFFVLDNEDNDVVSSVGFYGVNIRVSNNVRGLGISVFDSTNSWGSGGKLKSAMYFPGYGFISSGPALHELCHNWAAYICNTYAPDNANYTGHWGVSNAGGQLGGFKYVRTVEENSTAEPGKILYQASFSSDEKNEDGSFEDGGFGPNANGGNGLPYSDIELYLMGMKSAQDLRSAGFHLDIYSGNSFDVSFSKGYFYSSTKTSYTIDDLIASKGARDPDSASSQKHFKVLTVLLSDETGTDHADRVIEDLEWFGGAIDDSTYSPRFYNFARATGGVGSLEVTGIENSLIPEGAPVIKTASPLPGGMVGVAYSQTLDASGTAPITWSINGGSLPAGLTLSTTGVISGTPTTAGTFAFTARAANTAGSAAKTLSISIVAPGGGGGTPPSVTTISLLGGTVWKHYSKALTAAGTAPITWSVSNGNLPAGLSLDPSTGEISGTPTVTGVFTFTVRATNSAGNATRDLILVIAGSGGGSGGGGGSGSDSGGGGCNAAGVAGMAAALLLGVSATQRRRIL